jgi:septal ring factor EnvC (AmiA/AmiB activator)
LTFKFTAVEDLPSKLELIQRKLVQNSEEIKAMHQSRNALFEELNTTQNQISELTANLGHTMEANQKVF